MIKLIFLRIDFSVQNDLLTSHTYQVVIRLFHIIQYFINIQVPLCYIELKVSCLDKNDFLFINSVRSRKIIKQNICSMESGQYYTRNRHRPPRLDSTTGNGYFSYFTWHIFDVTAALSCLQNNIISPPSRSDDGLQRNIFNLRVFCTQFIYVFP